MVSDSHQEWCYQPPVNAIKARLSASEAAQGEAAPILHVPSIIGPSPLTLFHDGMGSLEKQPDPLSEDHDLLNS